MTARGRSLLTSVLLMIGLLAALFFVPVPYVVLEPGPAIDTLGAQADLTIMPASLVDQTATKGRLRLTTVAVEGGETHVSVLTVAQAWFSGSKAVVPRTVVYPKSKSVTQTQQQDKADMVASQGSAADSALVEVGPAAVAGLADGYSGPLQKGDLITSVDGQAVSNVYDVRTALAGRAAGQTVPVGVTRGGSATTVVATLMAPAGTTSTPSLGIQVGPRTDVTVTVGLQNVGGPSAGLMLALAVVDELTPGDLTGGVDIAGTGTIDSSGTVGPIGGIQQKLRGARDAGSTVFLVPASNCAEAERAVPSGLRLVKISEASGVGLHQAHTYLEQIAAGRTDQPGC